MTAAPRERDSSLDKAKAILLQRLRRDHIVCLSRVRLSRNLRPGTLKQAADELVREGRARWDHALEGVLRFEG